MLFSVTLVSNYIALTISAWLGIYLISRRPRNLLSWLTALTLWSLSGLFLNVILALYDPIIPDSLPDIFRVLIPFWSKLSNGNNSTAWLQGWSVAPAIGFWHHASILIRPGELNPWRKIRVLAGYIVGVGAIIAQANAEIMTTIQGSDPLFLSSLEAGPAFIFFLPALVLFSVLTVINLNKSFNQISSNFRKKSLQSLIAATVVAGLTGPILIISSVSDIQMPIVMQTWLLGGATGLIGFNVLRYGSLTNDRIVRRDFVYNALATIILVSGYMGVTWIAVFYLGVSKIAYIVVLIISLVSFAFVDYLRRYLDTLFYKAETRTVRDNLLKLGAIARHQDIDDNLSSATESISSLVNATFAVLVSLSDNRMDIVASYNWSSEMGVVTGSGEQLLYDDITQVDKDNLPPLFAKIVLVLPLYESNIQLAALLLGRPENGLMFAKDDIEQLVYPSDQLALILSRSLKRNKVFKQLPSLIEPIDLHPMRIIQQRPVEPKDIEGVLRHLYDYSYLGNHQLSELSIVAKELAKKEITHIDRGKALNNILIGAIDRLKPDTEKIENPPSRKWYPYIILNNAYVKETDNRDIMSMLYISEGTFNRTRRAAIRSISQVLNELDTY